MQNIFVGMLFVFFNFNLHIGSATIGLIPNFVGYMFMAKGVAELAGYSAWFRQVRPLIIGMGIYTGIVYGIELFGGFSSYPLIVLLALVATVFSFIISYHIVMGIRDIEREKGQDLNADRLCATWKLLLVCTAIAFLLQYILLLGIFAILIAFVLSAYYLYVFYQSKQLFYQQNPAG